MFPFSNKRAAAIFSDFFKFPPHIGIGPESIANANRIHSAIKVSIYIPIDKQARKSTPEMLAHRKHTLAAHLFLRSLPISFFAHRYTDFFAAIFSFNWLHPHPARKNLPNKPRRLLGGRQPASRVNNSIKCPDHRLAHSCHTDRRTPQGRDTEPKFTAPFAVSPKLLKNRHPLLQ